MIGQHEVTVAEFSAFLNAVGATDGPYVSRPLTITRSGASGSYTYSPAANMASKPVAPLSWLTAARYVNWLHNGKPTGPQDASTTEAGAYALNGQTSFGLSPARAVDARYYIPTEAEWYKAAFYKGGGTNAGYWDYATQSDTAPTFVTATSTGDGVIP
jgi:formylglycine-generating enzyme required for sulfatase activity